MRQITLGKGCVIEQEGDWKLKRQGVSCEVKPLRCYFKCILGAGRGDQL